MHYVFLIKDAKITRQKKKFKDEKSSEHCYMLLPIEIPTMILYWPIPNVFIGLLILQ